MNFIAHLTVGQLHNRRNDKGAMANQKRRYRERLRRRAVAAGELIDLTDAARVAGLPCRVSISTRLMTSLVAPYPGARPRDYLPLATLLKLVAARIPLLTSTTEILRVPYDCLPYWLQQPCCLKMLVEYGPQSVHSIRLVTMAERYEGFKLNAGPSLPATLLVRLSEALHRLNRTYFATERDLLHPVNRFVGELRNMNPFWYEIDEYLHSVVRDGQPESPPDEHRDVTLNKLEELLLLLSACPAADQLAQVAALMEHSRTLGSPLAELGRIIEKLLPLAARAESAADSFNVLLILHNRIVGRLQRLQTVAASEEIMLVLAEVSRLETHLPPFEVALLAGLEENCWRLAESKSFSGVSGSGVWH